jgi:glycosyltransferase involved in cell wall biosynthesis
MKILHVTFSDHFGGANISAYRVHESLEQNNIDSKILVLDRSYKNKNNKNVILYKPEKIFFYRIRNYIAKILNYLIRNNCQNSFNFFNSGLANFINNMDVDIVNLHWINNEMISIKEIAEIKKPIVWTLHDMWAFCGTEHYTLNKRFIKGYSKFNNDSLVFDIPKFIWLKKHKYLRKKKISFISPSLWMLSKLKKSNLFKEQKKYLIRSPFKVKKIKILNRKKKDKVKLVFCAFNCFSDKRKGFEKLKKVLNKLDRKYNFELTTIGEDKKNYKDVNFKLKNIGYVSSQNKLLKYFCYSDALVIPSNSDNFPNVATEALSTGLPIICDKNSGTSEIITNYKNGLVLNEFNSKNFEKMFEWLINKKINNKLIRKDILKLISYKKTYLEYSQVYKNILNA